MSDRWFPGTDRSRPAPSDGGSILGGAPKCLWHDTETSVLPSYSTGFFPNMTLDPRTGRTWQHIGADRASRALRNESGGVQTNRWNVFQVEIIGWVNKIPFHPVMAEIAQWLHEVRGTPLRATVDWLPYDASFGRSRVRLSGAAWSTYAGHLGHMHAPENAHGDPGWPFPINQIITGTEPEKEWWEMPIPPDELQKIQVQAEQALASSDGQTALRKAFEAEVSQIVAATGANQFFVKQTGQPQVYVVGGDGALYHVPDRATLFSLGGSDADKRILEYPAGAEIWSKTIHGQPPGSQ